MIKSITAFLNKHGTLGRWILTVFLLFGIYTETGKWTTIAMFLVFLGGELEIVRRRRTQDNLDKLLDLMERIGKK